MSIREGTILAFERYQSLLFEKNMKLKAENRADTDPTSPEHLLFMCGTMIHKLKNDPALPIDKASRWLGFVQGVLICKKYTTVENERNITRPWFSRNA